jgi:hypothetical protein
VVVAEAVTLDLETLEIMVDLVVVALRVMELQV